MDYRSSTGIGGRAQELVEVRSSLLELTPTDGVFKVEVVNNDSLTSYEVTVNGTIVGPVGTSLQETFSDTFNLGPSNVRSREYVFDHSLQEGAEVTACANPEITGGGGGGL